MLCRILVTFLEVQVILKDKVCARDIARQHSTCPVSARSCVSVPGKLAPPPAKKNIQDQNKRKEKYRFGTPIYLYSSCKYILLVCS